MTASPFDMPGSSRPGPRAVPNPPPAPARPPFLPALVVEIPAENDDAYERRAGAVLKVFPTRPEHTDIRIGIRHERARAETRLNPVRLRELAADLIARADFLDPSGATDG